MRPTSTPTHQHPQGHHPTHPNHRTTADRGFTLVELLVTVIIIGVLAGIAIPVYQHQKAKAADATVEATVRAVATAVEGDGELRGALWRATGDRAVVDALGRRVPVAVSDQVAWGISGTPASFCVAAHHLSGDAQALTPILWDSGAGGLAASGVACTPATVPSIGTTNGGGGDVVAAPRNLLADSGLQYVTESRLDTAGARWDDDGWYGVGGAWWAYRTVASPAGSRAVEFRTSSTTSSEGVTVFQGAGDLEGLGHPVAHGERYTVSAYVRAPEGTPLNLTVRVTGADRSWRAEHYTPVTATGEWQRVHRTFDALPVHVGGYVAVQVQTRPPYVDAGTFVQVAGPQVELGELSAFQATAPAPAS